MFRGINTFLIIILFLLVTIYLTGLGLLDHIKARQRQRNVSATRKFTSPASIIMGDQVKSNDDTAEVVYRRTEARLEARRKNMLDSCVKNKRSLSVPTDVAFVTNPSLKTTLFFSDKYKLLLCEIPKCASTNQAKFLAMAEGLMTIEESKNMPSIRATTIAHRKLSARVAKNLYEVTKRMETYTSMIIVREPFSRVLSAFRNKLENRTDNGGYGRLAKFVHEIYSGKNSTDANQTSPVDLSFDDFTKYLTGPERRAISDPHWRLYEKLCAPCDVKYDFIVHLDTLQEDMEFIINKLNITNTYFPPSYNSFTDWQKVKKYYSDVEPNSVNALYHAYKIDYDLFGFPPPPQF